MKNQIFSGVGVAIVTPMYDDGSINYECLSRLVEFQINGGVDSIVVCGTTGESATLSDKEKEDTIKFVVNIVNGRVPVIAGTGSNDTAHSIYLTQMAKNLGVQGTLVVTPYYNKTSQKGLIQHFYTISDCTDLPTILYNVPSRTGMNIEPNTYFELCKHPTIVATKDASGNFSNLSKTRFLCGDSLAIYSGNDDQIMPVLSLGGIGVISVVANILPAKTKSICSDYFSGNVCTARKTQIELMDIIDCLFCDVNPIAVKKALHIMQFSVGSCRLPLSSLSEQDTAKLIHAMRTHGLI